MYHQTFSVLFRPTWFFLVNDIEAGFSIKTFTYYVIQAKIMHQSFIFQFVYMQLDKYLNCFLETFVFE